MSGILIKTLLDAKLIDGDGDIVAWDSQGEGSYEVDGTWDGATVTLYWSISGDVWKVMDNATFTADGGTTIIGGRCLLKATISSAGSGTSLSARFVPQAINTVARPS